MPLICHIDGVRVKLNDDLEAVSTAAGGYDTLTATVDRDEVRHAHQESHVTLETERKQEVWYGTLDATPTASRHQVLSITATGPVAVARRRRDNRLYQNRDYSMWTDQSSDPYGYAAAGRIGVNQVAGQLIWNIPNGTDMKNGNAGGYVAWFPSEAVTRVAFDWTTLNGTSNMVLQILTASGPSGTRTQRGSNIAVTGASGSVDNTLAAGDDDLINLQVVWTAADATTGNHIRLRINNLRVNGRAIGDAMSPGLVIADMGGALGYEFNTKTVVSSGQNALPFYWPGGSWSDAFDQLALLDDWPWMVTRNQLFYRPWRAAVWNLRFSEENEDLNWGPIYNQVQAFYTTLAGTPKSVIRTASPDPLGRWGVTNTYQYDLSDSYQSDEIPGAVASSLLEHLTVQRAVGTVTVTSVPSGGRVWTPRKHWNIGNTELPYHVTPGTLAYLEPYPDLPPQRIISVRYHAHDVQVEFGEDVEQISASRTLAKVAGKRARKQRHFKPGK